MLIIPKYLSRVNQICANELLIPSGLEISWKRCDFWKEA
jgi:hypothetical protein